MLIETFNTAYAMEATANKPYNNVTKLQITECFTANDKKNTNQATIVNIKRYTVYLMK